MIITAVYDKKANYYDFVTSYVNRATAIRQFEQVCQDPNTLLSKYPDFELVELGTIDQSSGDIISAKVVLHRNSDLIKNEGE